MSVQMLVLDVDGVLTDGSIIYDDGGRELKRFSVRDGLWMRAWTTLGLSTAILSARSSAAVERRAAELGVAHVIQGSGDKAAHVRSLAAASGVDPGDMAFMGDDLPDLGAMRLVGYPMAPANADERVIEAAQYVTTATGGRGAVREAVMHLLEREGRLDEVLSKYDGR